MVVPETTDVELAAAAPEVVAYPTVICILTALDIRFSVAITSSFDVDEVVIGPTSYIRVAAVPIVVVMRRPPVGPVVPVA